MKFARTVCGDIQAEEMGFTYPHEHLYAVPPTCQKDRDLEICPPVRYAYCSTAGLVCHGVCGCLQKV